MNEKDYPIIRDSTTTTIDLRVIGEQLDTVEHALMMAYHYIAWWSMGEPNIVTVVQKERIAEALDTLLAMKKSFGFVSHLTPVKERQSAVISQVVHQDGEEE